MDIKYCSKCGTQIKPNAKYCPNCGNAITTKLAETSSSKSHSASGYSNRVSWELLGLCFIFIAATCLCLAIVTFDIGEAFAKRQYADCIPNFSQECTNSLYTTPIVSGITAILLLSIGIKKLSQVGNWFMLIASIVVLCISLFECFVGLTTDSTVIFPFLLCGSMCCSLIYIWTSFYRGIYSYSRSHILCMLLCFLAACAFAFFFMRAFYYY